MNPEIEPSANVTEALEKLVREAKRLGIRVTIARQSQRKSRGESAQTFGNAQAGVPCRSRQDDSEKRSETGSHPRS